MLRSGDLPWPDRTAAQAADGTRLAPPARRVPSRHGAPAFVAAIGQAVSVLHACTLKVDLRIPDSHSLKAKRAVVKHLVEGARSRFHVSAAEVGAQDKWQRCELGFAAVSGTPAQVTEVLDSVERFIWSEPQVDVVSSERAWIEADA